MAVSYNGQGPSLIDRFKGLLGRKEALPVARQHTFTPFGATWGDKSPSTLNEYYTTNSIVFACVSIVAEAFASAPLRVYRDDGKTEIANHPVRKLVKRPNYLMGEAEFWKYILAYKAVGGNAFSYFVPTNGGEPGEMWPYHRGQMAPVGSEARWVDHYAYWLGNGQYMRVDLKQVAHYKWAVNPQKPELGLSPLEVVTREVETDSELQRYQKALLENDAVPRGILKMPAGVPPLQPEQRRVLKADWSLEYGGDRRGRVALLENGIAYERVALTFDELAAGALRGMFEADICSAFGVHPVKAKVKLGIEHSTYSNQEEADRDFYESTIAPKWEGVAAELQNAMEPYYGSDLVLRFDTSRIKALQENEDKKWARVLNATKSRVLKVNEAREALGYHPVDDGDVFLALPTGKEKGEGEGGAGSDADRDGQYGEGEAANGDVG